MRVFAVDEVGGLQVEEWDDSPSVLQRGRCCPADFRLLLYHRTEEGLWGLRAGTLNFLSMIRIRRNNFSHFSVGAD